MKKFALFLLTGAFFLATPSFSQSNIRGTVKGVLMDTTDGKQPLVNATISVTPLAGDSTDAEYTVSGKGGAFQMKGLRAGQYRLLITYEGYQHIAKRFSISDTSSVVDFSTLYMRHADKMLAEVIIQRPPMGIKKDTVEYNAGSFAVKPNAVAEDLLKKLPGVTVDNSGNITAHGETVQRVLVDGKRFFSDDPKLATRNLPPDIIDKIQVFDDLSDQSKFTGFDDGNRVKTINIVTKKNSRHGYFGRVAGGGGTNQDYDENINMHRFDGNQQVSVLGQGNDINKQNFSPQDIFGGGGGGGRRGGGGGFGAATSPQSTGVTTVWAGGANYRNTFGTNPNHSTDLYGSYFYNFQHTSVQQTDSSISPVHTNYPSDSAFVSNGNSNNISRIQSHRVYLNLESRFDSNNSLIFRPNVTFQKSTPSGSSFNEETDNHLTPINSSNGHTSSTNSGFQINGTNLQLRHRFAKPYRTISLDVNATANINNGYGYNYSINNIYRRNITDTLNQFYLDSLHSWTVTPSLSYTEPLSKSQILQFNYTHVYTRSTTINDTYDFVDSVKAYNRFDNLFSNSYRFTQNSDQVGLYWRIQHAKYNFSAGSGVQWTKFDSYNTTKGIPVDHGYTNYTPTVNFNYQFSNTSHLRMNYAGRTGTPSASQLQPLTTTSDSISFQIGNPALKPQFTHSLRILYANFNPGTQRVIFATVNASTIVNDIQSAVYRNALGGQNTKYVNLDGTYNVSGFFNYGFPLKHPKSNLNFMTNITYAQSQSLLAQDSLSAAAGRYAHEYTRNTGLNETIRWTTNIKKNFDMNFSSTTGYTINKNPGAQQSTSDTAKAGNVSSSTNLNTFTETLSTEFTAYTNSGWLIAATFDYTYAYTASNTYTAHIPLLTPSIAKQLFKKKNGEIRLTVFDVLNKNTSVSKSVGTFGAVTYNRTNVLSRYAMLTFTWNLNNFAGQNQRRMPGFFPGRFRGDGGGGGGFRDGGGNFPIN
ncbi:outer membrane beta-barrel protein [Puia dinghuensis]|uniref:Collagen-binding protein n=1 Tax=Puia dinghuensis TaxID=1792502 RepID=A0A8J2UFM1_9BACT|nr:outer membrane beta-barrel protein [Puia dinghuensis]GGB10298.1 collagen-binding protein [Puia dinghuensis]